MMPVSRTDRSLLSRWWWTVDRWTLITVFILAALGIVLTMTASPAVAHKYHYDSYHFALRQAFYLPVSLCILVATSLLSPKGVRRLAFAGFAVAGVLTIATLFFGAEVKGSVRWLRLGGFSVQPSEFLKPAFAVVCAWWFARSRLGGTRTGYALATASLVVIAGVLALQPDIGTTLLMAGIWSVQVFLAGCPLVIVGLLVFGFLGGGLTAYLCLDHVRKRIDYFLNPTSGEEGYQVERALSAFRSGGLFGRGPGEGQVKEVLPDAHSDFIFAVAGEEFGLVLCVVVVGLFAFVVIKALSRALRDSDLFAVLAASSLISLFGAQALMNMASTLHLMPPKGITLPFISYGGSATIALAWAMGMVLALTRQRPSAEDPR
jgi:cell division protein FtsW